MTVTDQEVEEQGQGREVKIEVNYRPVFVPRETTGAQIKSNAGLPADAQLFRIRGEDEIPVGDQELVTVHPGEKFVATPGLEPA